MPVLRQLRRAVGPGGPVVARVLPQGAAARLSGIKVTKHIAMLFIVGQKWAQYAHTSRLIAGLVMVAIGLALVGVAVCVSFCPANMLVMKSG